MRIAHRHRTDANFLAIHLKHEIIGFTAQPLVTFVERNLFRFESRLAHGALVFSVGAMAHPDDSRRAFELHRCVRLTVFSVSSRTELTAPLQVKGDAAHAVAALAGAAAVGVEDLVTGRAVGDAAGSQHQYLVAAHAVPPVGEVGGEGRIEVGTGLAMIKKDEIVARTVHLVELHQHQWAARPGSAQLIVLVLIIGILFGLGFVLHAGLFPRLCLGGGVLGEVERPAESAAREQHHHGRDRQDKTAKSELAFGGEQCADAARVGGIQAATLYAMASRESATAQKPRAAGRGELETVEFSTGPNPTASVVWLHGLGADGHDFEPIVPQLSWPGAPDIRYVFPHAPVRPVTINGGIPMRAWYDIVSLSSARGQDREGIVDSVNQVAALLRREIAKGISPRRIILAGFSQGGAIALQLALRFPEPLAGVVALSSYLLFGERLESQQHEANAALPAFVGHGSADPVVPIGLGQEAARKLEQLGHPVEWHSYPMVHAVCPDEVGHLKSWMQARLE